MTHDHNDNHDPRLRQALQALPEVDLPDALWSRVDGARRHQLARRHVGLGAGALVLLAAGLMPLWHSLPAPDVASSQITAAGKPATTPSSTSPVTGTSVATAPGMAGPAPQSRPQTGPSLPDLDTRLRTLDRDLQAAYRDGASNAEIAQLWQARRALLEGDDSTAGLATIRI